MLSLWIATKSRRHGGTEANAPSPPTLFSLSCWSRSRTLITVIVATLNDLYNAHADATIPSLERAYFLIIMPWHSLISYKQNLGDKASSSWNPSLVMWIGDDARSPMSERSEYFVHYEGGSVGIIP